MRNNNRVVQNFSLLLIIIGIWSCQEQKETAKLEQYEETASVLPLDRLTLPDGFKIEVYADSLDGARSMALGDNGTIFVGTRNENKVYAVQDRDKGIRESF